MPDSHCNGDFLTTPRKGALRALAKKKSKIAIITLYCPLTLFLTRIYRLRTQ